MVIQLWHQAYQHAPIGALYRSAQKGGRDKLFKRPQLTSPLVAGILTSTIPTLHVVTFFPSSLRLLGYNKAYYVYRPLINHNCKLYRDDPQAIRLFRIQRMSNHRHKSGLRSLVLVSQCSNSALKTFTA